MEHGFEQRCLVTERLSLREMTLDDLDELHRIYSDPATWEHLPAGRHTSVEQTRAMIERTRASWASERLGYWTLRLLAPLPDGSLAAGAVIGSGGVTLGPGDSWNLGYRLTPPSWGHGLASEAVEAALAAAHAVAPERPVLARLLERNPGSRRVAERAGMQLLTSELEPDGPAAGLRRLVYTDRPPAR